MAAQREGLAPPSLPAEVTRALVAYAWPGNIRELENEMSRLVVLAGRGPILRDHLSPRLAGPADLPSPLRQARERFEREFVVRALARNGGTGRARRASWGSRGRPWSRRSDAWGCRLGAGHQVGVEPPHGVLEVSLFTSALMRKLEVERPMSGAPIPASAREGAQVREAGVDAGADGGYRPTPSRSISSLPKACDSSCRSSTKACMFSSDSTTVADPSPPGPCSK
jgi:hypothetical protein